jgi:nucleoside-diphosphate-sugar epimerase
MIRQPPVKTVFLTGGTGFIGSHVARKFMSEGWGVRALVRNPSRPGLLPPGVEVVPAALVEVPKYRDAMRDCQVVLHLAGTVKACSLKEYRESNARGTEAVARAAADACPGGMFVLVSSQSAAGPSRTGRPVGEYDPPRPVSWYGISKHEGEQAVRRYRNGPWCVVRPCVVYGPGDPGVLELFKTVESGWAPILAGGRTRIQLIAVEDLARILYASALRPELSGRTTFAAGQTVTTGELAREIAALRRPPAREFPVPAWAVRAAGAWESLRQRLTGKARPFNADKAREVLQSDWTCDSGSLLRDLQISVSDFQPWKQGFRTLCRCYVASQWLRPSMWAV